MKYIVREVKVQNGKKRMNDRFCCFCTYKKNNIKCLIKCKDRNECEKETNFLKWLKYDYPKQKEENENAKKNSKR